MSARCGWVMAAAALPDVIRGRWDERTHPRTASDMTSGWCAAAVTFLRKSIQSHAGRLHPQLPNQLSAVRGRDRRSVPFSRCVAKANKKKGATERHALLAEVSQVLSPDFSENRRPQTCWSSPLVVVGYDTYLPPRKIWWTTCGSTAAVVWGASRRAAQGWLVTKFLKFSTRFWFFLLDRPTDQCMNVHMYVMYVNGRSTAVTSLLSPVSTTLLDCREIPCGCVSFFSIPEAFSAGRESSCTFPFSTQQGYSSSSSFFPPKKSTFSVQNIVCPKHSSYYLRRQLQPASQSIQAPRG